MIDDEKDNGGMTPAGGDTEGQETDTPAGGSDESPQEEKVEEGGE